MKDARNSNNENPEKMIDFIRLSRVPCVGEGIFYHKKHFTVIRVAHYEYGSKVNGKKVAFDAVIHVY